MENIAFRSVFLLILDNQSLTKSVSCLAKISYLHYSTRNNKEKKIKCAICGRHYESAFLLIIHIQLIHQGVFEVKKYEVVADTLAIECEQMQKTKQLYPKYINKFDGNHRKKHDLYLTFTLGQRCKSIVNMIMSKIVRHTGKNQQIFFHSNDIFRRISDDSIGQDSEEDIGDIEKELEKLKIQDFTDVNESDKYFFIQWNSFLHEQRKLLNLIYAHDIPKIYIQFSRKSPSLNISRINLIMHGWTLWSVGQIKAIDITKALVEYDRISDQEKQN